MTYYILCTADTVSGGPELAHQLCGQIMLNGSSARMYYVKSDQKEPVDTYAPERYEKYGTVRAASLELADSKENIIIIPEGLTDWAFVFKNAKIILWWMSVDNFRQRFDDGYIYRLDKLCSLHLTQSKYSEAFLKSKNIDSKKILWLSDYIGEIYNRFILPPEYRVDKALFNPKKGYEELKPLIKMCSFVTWKPLIDMTEEEVVMNMQVAKVYVDFGSHPGKDRIPREAAACGLCVITNKKGSAGFYDDVPINEKYKFGDPIDYEKAACLLKDIVDNYSSHFHSFDNYRSVIRSEKQKFEADVKKLLSFKL